MSDGQGAAVGAGWRGCVRRSNQWTQIAVRGDRLDGGQGSRRSELLHGGYVRTAGGGGARPCMDGSNR